MQSFRTKLELGIALPREPAADQAGLEPLLLRRADPGVTAFGPIECQQAAISGALRVFQVTTTLHPAFDKTPYLMALVDNS